MAHKKKIKTLLGLFLFFMVMLFVSYFAVYHYNFFSFNQELYQRSQQHLKLTNALDSLEDALYVHQQALEYYFATGDFEVLQYVKEAQARVTNTLQLLENFSQTTIENWIPLSETQFGDVRDSLSKQLSFATNSAETDSLHQNNFSKLFYLVTFNVRLYFERTQGLIGLYDEANLVENMTLLKDQEDHAGMIFAASKRMAQEFSGQLWSVSAFQKSEYTQLVTYFFYGLLALTALLLLFAILVVRKVVLLSGKAQPHDEKYLEAATKDLETGIFNHKTFSVMTEKELERAKRKKHSLMLLLLRIESYAQIKTEYGEDDAGHYVFQVATALRAVCRQYESIYRFAENTFVVVMEEATEEQLYAIISRFKESVFEKDFFIHDEQHKIKPVMAIGYALFPLHGSNLDSLIQHATSHLMDAEGRLLDAVVEEHLPETKALKEQETKAAEAFPEPLVSQPEPEADSFADDEQESQANVAVKFFDSLSEPETVTPDDEEEPVDDDVPAPQEKFFFRAVPDEKLKKSWESLLAAEASANQAKTVPPRAREPSPEYFVPEQDLQTVVTQQAHQVPDPLENSFDSDAIPDVVAALNQVEQPYHPEPEVKKLFNPPEIRKEEKPVPAHNMSGHGMKKRVSLDDIAIPFEPVDENEQYDDFDDITNISDIRVMNSREDGSEVIMVDFDENEKKDLAQKFRKKLRQRKLRQMN